MARKAITWSIWNSGWKLNIQVFRNWCWQAFIWARTDLPVPPWGYFVQCFTEVIAFFIWQMFQIIFKGRVLHLYNLKWINWNLVLRLYNQQDILGCICPSFVIAFNGYQTTRVISKFEKFWFLDHMIVSINKFENDGMLTEVGLDVWHIEYAWFSCNIWQI